MKVRDEERQHPPLGRRKGPGPVVLLAEAPDDLYALLEAEGKTYGTRMLKVRFVERYDHPEDGSAQLRCWLGTQPIASDEWKNRGRPGWRPPGVTLSGDYTSFFINNYGYYRPQPGEKREWFWEPVLDGPPSGLQPGSGDATGVLRLTWFPPGEYVRVDPKPGLRRPSEFAEVWAIEQYLDEYGRKQERLWFNGNPPVPSDRWTEDGPGNYRILGPRVTLAPGERDTVRLFNWA